jgi:predicted Na+-dependent transporter
MRSQVADLIPGKYLTLELATHKTTFCKGSAAGWMELSKAEHAEVSAIFFAMSLKLNASATAMRFKSSMSILTGLFRDWMPWPPSFA